MWFLCTSLPHNTYNGIINKNIAIPSATKFGNKLYFGLPYYKNIGQLKLPKAYIIGHVYSN